MKKEDTKPGRVKIDADEILPQYDFSRSRPNKYAAQYSKGGTVVVLEPDLAALFPTAGDVNDALRALAKIIQKHHPRGTRVRARV